MKKQKKKLMTCLGPGGAGCSKKFMTTKETRICLRCAAAIRRSLWDYRSGDKLGRPVANTTLWGRAA